MASTFTDLGLELMATGENAGTWGTKTNANLSLIEQLTGGVIQVSTAGGAGNTLLDIDNGALTGTAQQRVIELTGSISGNRVIQFPLLTENFYIIKNGTTGAYTVQLKAVSGSGATVTFSATDKGYKLIYLDGVATNTGLFEATVGATGDVTLTGTQTLTNKTLTLPKINENVTTTSTSTELNILDGVTSTTAELNILDGVTATAAELNYSDLATLGTSAASKVITANANNLTTISGAILNTQDTLTDQATIAWDVIASPVAFVTLGGNRTMAAPSGTGAAAGQFISLLVKQDGTGSRTITWNAVYEFPSDTAPTLTTTANLGDIFSFRYNGAKWLLIGQTLALTLS
jgi:hypothetical protein